MANLTKYVLVALIALQAAQAVACSCLPIEELSSRQIERMTSQYPVIVRASVVSTEYPATCRIAPLRWFTRLFGDRAVEVRHTLAVKSIIRGKPAKHLAVIQEQWVNYGGCLAAGEAACEINVKVTDDLWILRPVGRSTFKRAGLCTSMNVVDALRR